MDNNRQTLSEVVRLYLVEEGEYSEHKFAKYMTFGLRIMKELNIDVAGGIKARIIKADKNNPLRYNLPNDCVKVIRAGICDRGVIVAMAKEPSLCIVEKLDDCGNVVVHPVTDTQQTGQEFTEIFWTNEVIHGEYKGGRYGVRGGQSWAGVFRVDEPNGQLVVGSDLDGIDVVLEYVSDGTEDVANLYVHPLIEEALIAGVRWLAIRSKPRMSMNHIIEARKEFYNQKRLARARKTFPSKEELIQYARRGYQSAPKM